MKYDLGEIEVVKRNRLPHWVGTSSIYFVTWHLADALPVDFLDSLRRETEYEIERIRKSRGALTIADRVRLENQRRRRIEKCLDLGFGECVLRNPDCARLVAGAIEYFNSVRYELLSWTVMPNHAHVVFTCLSSFGLPDLVKSWKNYSSREVNRLLGRRGMLWQEDYFDRSMRDSIQLQRTLKYVADNASRAGLIGWDFVAAYPEAISRHI